MTSEPRPTGDLKKAVKRPRTKGGFVMDSDESDNEDQDDEKFATAPIHNEQSIHTARNRSISTKPLPANQANKAHLKTLLSQTKIDKPQRQREKGIPNGLQASHKPLTKASQHSSTPKISNSQRIRTHNQSLKDRNTIHKPTSTKNTTLDPSAAKPHLVSHQASSTAPFRKAPPLPDPQDQITKSHMYQGHDRGKVEGNHCQFIPRQELTHDSSGHSQNQASPSATRNATERHLVSKQGQLLALTAESKKNGRSSPSDKFEASMRFSGPVCTTLSMNLQPKQTGTVSKVAVDHGNFSPEKVGTADEALRILTSQTAQHVLKRKIEQMTDGMTNFTAMSKKPALGEKKSSIAIKTNNIGSISSSPAFKSPFMLDAGEKNRGNIGSSRTAHAPACATARKSQAKPEEQHGLRSQHMVEGIGAPTTMGKSLPLLDTGLDRSSKISSTSAAQESTTSHQSLMKKGKEHSLDAVSAKHEDSWSSHSDEAMDFASVAGKEQQALVLPQCTLSSVAEAYMEYTISQRIWTSSVNEADSEAQELLVNPSLSIDQTNTQAQSLFEASLRLLKHSMLLLTQRKSERDKIGCMTHTATLSPADNPSDQVYLKIWVQCHYVSKYANKTHGSVAHLSFISSTVYILRSFKLLDVNVMSDSEGDPSFVRTHYQTTRPEVYTTLAAANRAARNLQIELSHEKNPGKATTAAWQEQNLKDLNGKLRSLEAARNAGEACWRSEFNGSGKGGNRYEVIVEQVGICGPRNI
ncbi:hypothetical protein ACN47E_008434 [Coniothyrium glycines]